MTTHKGKITSMGDRQSGFIARKGIKEDLFFHADHVLEVPFKELRVGDTVEFEVEETRNGPYATSVTRIK